MNEHVILYCCIVGYEFAAKEYCTEMLFLCVWYLELCGDE